MNSKTRYSAQSLIEYAFIIPIVLVLLLGFFDLGRAIFYYSSLSNAVREGARSGIVMDFNDLEGDKNDIKKIVVDFAFGLTNTSIPLIENDVTVNPIKNGDGFYENLTVSATYCFVPVTPGIMLILNNTCTNGGSGLDLQAEAIMRIESGSY